jgi:hypothetical protein
LLLTNEAGSVRILPESGFMDFRSFQRAAGSSDRAPQDLEIESKVVNSQSFGCEVLKAIRQKAHVFIEWGR